MKEIIKTEYQLVPVKKKCFVSEDGKEFDTEQECLEPENRIKIIGDWVEECKKAGMNGEEIILCYLTARWLTQLSYAFLAKVKEINSPTLLTRLEKLKEEINNED